MTNQLSDSSLWDSTFYLVSIFGTNKFIDAKIKNTLRSLFKIVEFIKQRILVVKQKKIYHILQSLAIPLGILFHPSLNLDRMF